MEFYQMVFLILMFSQEPFTGNSIPQSFKKRDDVESRSSVECINCSPFAEVSFSLIGFAFVFRIFS